MSLNPSNTIAALANPGKTMFPNLARPCEEKHFAEVDEKVQQELAAAGIEANGPNEWCRQNNEVPAAFFGKLCLWDFRRAWYYWKAYGPGIPADKAQAFWEHWGTQVRTDGHCGYPSPLELFKGFAVSRYHIDTQEGLTAFAELLKSIYVEGKKP